MNSYTRIKGFADMASPEIEVMRYVERTARDIFGRFGYRELSIPILEKTELFSRSIGDETDVVQKEMYTFPDRKGRSLTLRPEATAGVMRAYIENRLFAREQTTKLFTLGPMFRYERPQKGRMRQFHQVNAECLGPVAPQADVETMLMLWLFLRELGLDEVSIELNSLGCAACRPAYREALNAFLSGLDSSKLCEDCVRRVLSNPLRVLDCKAPGCKELVADAPVVTDYICAECRDHFEVVTGLLLAAGLPYRPNPRLVRGLDYYVRTTFEVVSGNIGAQSSVAGGGRYDGLVHALGGPDVAGVGFACGMERLLLLLSAPKAPELDFFLAVLDPLGLNKGLLLAQRLREEGLSGEAAFMARSVKSQMREANKCNARACLLLGAEELANDTVVVKDMKSGNQQVLELASLPALVACLQPAE